MSRIVFLSLAVLLGLALNHKAHATADRTRGEPVQFEAVDADGNGSLSRAELRQFREARQADILRGADADGDGRLDRSELTAAMVIGEDARRARRVEAMITRLDANQDGALSVAEIERARADGSERRLLREDRLFRRFDADGSGELSAAESAEIGVRLGRTGSRFGPNAD